MKQNLIFITQYIENCISKLRLCHQRGYKSWVEKPRYYSLTLAAVAWLVHIFAIAPLIIWVIFGIACGTLSFMLLEINICNTALYILTSIVAHLIICGKSASCTTNHGFNYTLTFFQLVAENTEVLLFHVLFCAFIALSVFYFSGLFMSLANKRPKLKFPPLYTFIVLILAYMMAIWILGLNQFLGPKGINTFTFMCLPGFTILGLICWYINQQRLERVVICFVMFLVGLALILYNLFPLWSDITDFFKLCYDSLILLWAKVCAFIRWLKNPWPIRTQWRGVINYMWGWSSKSDSESAKTTETPMEPASPCSKKYHQTNVEIHQQEEKGHISGAEAAQKLKQSTKAYETCKQTAWEKSKFALHQSVQATKALRDEEIAEAKHNWELKKYEKNTPIDTGKVVNNASDMGAGAVRMAETKLTKNS